MRGHLALGLAVHRARARLVVNLLPMLPATVPELAQRLGWRQCRVRRALRPLLQAGQAARLGHKRTGARGPGAVLYGPDAHNKVRAKGRRRRLANLLAHAEVAELHGLTDYARKARHIYARFCPAGKLWQVW